jgi:hypothetical protein
MTLRTLLLLVCLQPIACTSSESETDMQSDSGDASPKDALAGDACPEAPGGNGTPCPTPGLYCEWGAGCPRSWATCRDGGWFTEHLDCLPDTSAGSD